VSSHFIEGRVLPDLFHIDAVVFEIFESLIQNGYGQINFLPRPSIWSRKQKLPPSDKSGFSTRWK
jgi:hypothetical protein